MSNTFETSRDVEWLKNLYFSNPAQQLIIEKGETLLAEDQYNDRLFLIMQGTLTGFLKDENNEQYEVYKSTRNMFAGVYSFFSPEHKSYLTLVADERTTVAYIEQSEKEESENEFAKHFMPVIVHEIYLRQLLAQRLTQQRQAAIKKLYEKEKMATLGQLAAGLAHELNNAVGVLDKNAQWLAQAFAEYLKNKKMREVFLNAVQQGQQLSTVELRERRKKLEKRFSIPTALAKQLARTSLSDEQITALLKDKSTETESINIITEAGIVLHDMHIAASHASHVVQSVRELGVINLHKTASTTISETINKALALVKPLQHNIAVSIIKETDGPIVANPGDLVQVWLNLIKNAYESMTAAATPDPMLTVYITSTDKMYSVTIRDNGPGISEDLASKIFQPNFTTKISGLSFGLGLGLSIVKKIVNEYKGTIRVDNKEGQVDFIVQLPKN